MTLFNNTVEWIHAKSEIDAAVIFGSTSRGRQSNSSQFHDIDIHIVVSFEEAVTATDWAIEFPNDGFCLAVHRPATGGVRKTTVLFLSGQLDLVLVPTPALKVVSERFRNKEVIMELSLATALNEMATCLHSGYQFIKGYEKWGDFYNEVSELPGVRLCDEELCLIGDSFLADILWVVQKASAGEIVAAQNALHCKISNSCLRLYREFNIRCGERLVSFGLGRHLEKRETDDIVRSLTINARADRDEIRRECQKSLGAFRVLMAKMYPKWEPTDFMVELLSRFDLCLSPTAR